MPDAVRAPVMAYADPHPPGARARAQLAAQALIELVGSWAEGAAGGRGGSVGGGGAGGRAGRGESVGAAGSAGGLAEAVQDLVGHLHTVGQTTLHQPGVTNMIEAVLGGGLDGDPSTVAARMRERYESITATMAAASETMAVAGSALLRDGDTILVHDFADRSTQAVVRQAATDGKHLTVVATACRSRRTDGIRVARESVAVGHEAIVVTDAGVGWAVSTMDLRLCLIGADAILPDGTVLTSPGALTIALAGQWRGIPVFAVTDLWKIMVSVSPELVALNEVEDPDGVPEALEWAAAGYGYRNPLIDVVPGETLRGLITEAGVIAPSIAG
ncbi:MAG: ribose 1,5-bisphosphate isomerase, partial [Chloroflexota bacterium]|nr:ribose 1,5-bisphosphate isomerase [Chloroflexota bacterium]